MTWPEATRYCNWLSEQDGIPETQWCYKTNSSNKYGPGMRAKPDFFELAGYRLPTEAEWEFACRSGTITSRNYGHSQTLLSKYAWHLHNAREHTWPVGTLKPNDFGLFDVHGNAFEWCFDIPTNYVSDGVVVDAVKTGPLNPTIRRVLRGGSFSSPSVQVRSAFRYVSLPGYRDIFNGFRPVRTHAVSPEPAP